MRFCGGGGGMAGLIGSVYDILHIMMHCVLE